MHSNRYIFIYSAVMVVIVAVALTVVAVQLKPAQENNIRVEKMQNILASANIVSTTKNAEELFNKYIVKSLIVNNKGEKFEENAFPIDLVYEFKAEPENRKWPVFICKQDAGDTNYIVPVRGKGLWGPVWGYIAFKNDFNTVVGTMFSHKGETPGLGAEIDTEKFQSQFKGKTIFDENNNLVSIEIIKGGATPDNTHGVDAISGGTITSKGLEASIKDCLKEYEPFFKNNRK